MALAPGWTVVMMGVISLTMTTPKHPGTLLVCIVIFFTTLASHAATTTYTKEEGVHYYDSSINHADAYIEERCVLDIYHPTNLQGYPSVIWFHGGGLESGEKFVPEALMDKGIAVIAVNYRLYPRARAEDAVADATAAVAWTLKHIAEYGGDPSAVFVSGHSAGGYLAMMSVLDKRRLAAYQLDANSIAGVIPFSGHTITHMTIRKERGIPDTQPVVDEWAPLYYVRADAPPLLLITGDRNLEFLGRYEENAYMMRMMRLAGHKETRILEIQGYGHSMAEPAFPLLLNEVHRVLDERKSHQAGKPSAEAPQEASR